MTVPQEARKLRILCLHGYLQNAEVSSSLAARLSGPAAAAVAALTPSPPHPRRSSAPASDLCGKR